MADTHTHTHTFTLFTANKAVFTASTKSERLDCERMSRRMEGGGRGGRLEEGGGRADERREVEEEDAWSSLSALL